MNRCQRGRGRRKMMNRALKQSLYYAELGKEYIVEDVPMSGMLPCLGIYPKSRIAKRYRYRMGGPVLLKVGNREVAIGKDIANQISVREVE